MIHRFLTILLVCTIVSCTDIKPKVSSVEYIGFTWTHWDLDNTQMDPFFFFFYCRTYAYIDNQGRVKVSLYGKGISPNLQYLLLQFNPEILGRLESIATGRNKEILDSVYNLHLNPIDRPRLYEGPSIKVQLNYSDGNSFIFNFIEDEEVFQLFPPLKEINKSMYGIAAKATGKFTDTLEFNKSRLSFIKRSIQNDTCFDTKYKLPIRILFNNKIVYADSLFKIK